MPAGGQGSNPSTYALTIGGVNYTLWVDAMSISWSESGTEAPAQFECVVASGEAAGKTVADHDFTGETLTLQDLANTRKLFSGFVLEAKRYHGVASVVYYAIRAVSWDALLDRYTIPKWRSTLDGTTRTKLILSDRAMVQKLVADYGYGITANNANVSNTNADMPRLTLTAVTTRDALQAVADAAAWPANPTARRFYVDFDKRLHYYKGDEGTNAPYKIGDRLYDGTYIIPDYIDYSKDISDAAKAVYIKGSNKFGTGLVSNNSTPTRPVDRVDLIDVPESDSSRALKAIATAYFNREGAAVVGGRFTVTGHDGWRAGQTVHIHDAAFGLNGNFQIREIQASPNMGNGVTTYDIAYGALPYRATFMIGRKSRAAAGSGGRTNPGAGGGNTDPAPNDDNRPGEGGGGGCFVAGTPVTTPNGMRAINELAAGDAVLAWNGAALVPATVSAGLMHPAHVEPRLLVTFEGGTELEVTIRHRFYDPILGYYRAIGEMLPGDAVYAPKMHRERKIAAIVWLGDAPTDVYNLTVQEHHNYLVCGILVHNSKAP